MLILVPNTNESVRLLPSDFPAENPRTQTRTFYTQTVTKHINSHS